MVNGIIRANKVKCNAAAPHGILSVPTGGKSNHNILTKYQSIFSANIAYVFVANTNNRITHNSKAFEAMLSNSITGTIHSTVFEQAQNLPTK